MTSVEGEFNVQVNYKMLNASPKTGTQWELHPESKDMQKDGKWNKNTGTCVERKDSTSLPLSL